MSNMCYFHQRTTSLKEQGALIFFEANRDISFFFKRIYYTCGVKKYLIRGYHAHKALEQVLICVFGSIEIMCDDGDKKEYTILDDPAKGLHIHSGIWHTMKWLTDDSVLLVIASDYYDESDYIRDYAEFVRLVKEGYWKK